METILYIGVIAFLIPLLVIIFGWAINVDLRSKVSRGIESEGLRAVQKMTFTIRNGATIESPTLSSTSSILIIRNSSDIYDTNKYLLDNDKIKVSKANGPLEPITSSNVKVSDLVFSNVSRIETAGTVTIRFKVSDRKQQKSFYVSASLRKK